MSAEDENPPNDRFKGTIFEGLEPNWEIVRCIRGQAEADRLRLEWQYGETEEQW
jgi:hypothetical protein